ncbi:MAG: hypothetical protein LQ341_005140 [Variospora aurantia]|nr:MAG: hypothetical protein LQ341_005140 [Variospora aurantia]
MSSNRRILPLQTSSSHSSPSNTQTEISPGAGQNGMANGNGMQVSSGTGESGDSLGREDASRKRRTPGLVAAIACTECRRARQKCDGRLSKCCTRCRVRKLECHYEPHTKTHKESLLKEIASLRQDNTRLRQENEKVEGTASDLQHENKGLLTLYEWQRIILDTIGRNGHDREIIQRLRAGETTQSIADWLCEQHPIKHTLHDVPEGSYGLVGIVDAFEEQLRQDDGQGRGKEADTLPFAWTAVSSSQTLLGHLFDLYFTWVHPVHMLFSEREFRASYAHRDETYCSSALVNAICAMACHMMDPNDDTAGDVDVEKLTTGFMNQARHEVKPQNYMHLTSVQALAVMYLADLSSGKARSATGYLRASVEFLKAAELGQQSAQAREISLWGIQTLNTSSTGMTYQKLYAPELPHMAKFQHVDLQSSHSTWQEYRSIGDQRYLPVRPSHAVLAACHQAGLFRIIHESLNLYCGLRGLITADAVLTLYRRYMDWEEDLPFILKAIDDEARPLPHILLLHVQFHVAVVQHLTPLLQSNFFDGPNLHELQRLMIKHAQDGIIVLEHLHQLYSGRFLMPLISFCTIHLGDTLIRYSPDEPPASNVVEFCLGLLQASSIGFPINGPLQELFRRTAVECGAALPPNVKQFNEQLGNYGMDDILDACTRLDYKQPVDQSVRHIDENIADEWASKWEQIVDSPDRPESPQSTRKVSPSEKHLRIESLLNQ